MQALTAYTADASSAPAVAAPRRAEAGAMPALYRAAIGPLHTDRYLAFFEREDDTGRRLTGWNWAAALCTLNWMVFRQLWGAALVYVAALEGVALLVFVLGYQWLELPRPVLAGLGLAWLFAASVLPGLYGDAIMHAEVRKKITKALSEAPTLAQARQRLEHQAPTRRRLMAFLAVNAALAGLVAALWFALPDGGRAVLDRLGAGPAPEAPVSAGAMPAASKPATATTVASAPIATPDAPMPAPTASDTAGATPTAAAPASAAASMPALPASEGAAAASEPVATAPGSATTSAPAPAAVAASAPAPVAAKAAPAAASGSAAAASAPAPVPIPAPTPAPAPTAVRAAAAVPAQTPASAASAAPAASSAPPIAQAPASAAAPAASTPAPAPRRTAAAPSPRRARPAAAAQATPAPAPGPVLTAAAPLPPLPEGGASERQLFINVGLFADPANARRAHARLLANGLPSSTALVTQRGTGRQLTRVRVGPFTATSEANAAVTAIRAMELEAAPALQ